MTDLEFYKKALIYQGYVINNIAQCKAYEDGWSNEFQLKAMREAFDDFVHDDEVKELFSIENLTKERATVLRFRYWDKDEFPDLMLFPLWVTFFIPYGTKVIGISGEEFEYTKETDLDIRCGCMAFGINLYK